MTLSVPPSDPRARCHPLRQNLSRAEAGLLLGMAALLALALFGPVLPASAHQHTLADQRALWGIPCALDVLSNLPFALAGLWGLGLLRRVARRACWMPVARAAAGLFFAGLVCTAAGSALYHWQPQDAGLLWDRLGMATAFAGLLGLAGASRVSCARAVRRRRAPCCWPGRWPWPCGGRTPATCCPGPWCNWAACWWCWRWPVCPVVTAHWRCTWAP